MTATNKLVLFLILTSVIILMTSQGTSGVKDGDKIEPCPACRYQRRSCKPDCIFRLYLPSNRRQDFLNVHRLFGIRNVKNLFKKTPLELRGDAMKSIVYQSNVRSRFPSHGCVHVIRHLLYQIKLVADELAATRTQLSAAAVSFVNPTAPVDSYDPTATTNNDDFARGVPVNDGTIDLLSRGGPYCDIPYEERETRPLERTNNSVDQLQQFLLNANDLGSIPNPANDFDFGAVLETSEQRGGAPSRDLTTANNHDVARGGHVSDGTIGFLSGGGQGRNIRYEECVTEPEKNNNNDVQQIIPNPNDLAVSLSDFDFVADLEALAAAPPNEIEFDYVFTDAERALFGIEDSGDKCW
ncbi:hypothetical protein CARUB_v10003813mg [Capsella rubella]|uniref:LOB domain-containing protein n=1 Tax=Capsella rubella TaxID=81985 RepID=R0H810_9BRAS|nr:hypothetical protein CARUB_v10003813mg [Capsella rubella]